MDMNRQTIASLIAAGVSLALLVLWFYAASTLGSGWLLFFSILAAFSALNHSGNSETQVATSIVVGAGFASVWYFASPLAYSGWLLFVLFLSVLSLFNGLNYNRQR